MLQHTHSFVGVPSWYLPGKHPVGIGSVGSSSCIPYCHGQRFLPGFCFIVTCPLIPPIEIMNVSIAIIDIMPSTAMAVLPMLSSTAFFIIKFVYDFTYFFGLAGLHPA